MELRQLRTFRTVATLRSFQQAAKILNYAQSTVSEQMKVLEEDLQVKLFDRSGKQIRLTEAGERLLQYAYKMLDLEEEIKTDVCNDGALHGSLSLRVPDTLSIYYFPPVVRAFHVQYPGVSLNFNPCTYYSLQQELQSGITNLAFLLTDEVMYAPDMETEILGEIPLSLVTHPDHPLASQASINIEDLKHASIFLPRGDCSYRMMFENMLIQAKVEPTMIFNFNSIEAIKTCIMAGIGMTLIPAIAVRKEIAQARLQSLAWAEAPLVANILMIWQKTKWLSSPLQAFMQLTREQLTRTRKPK